MSKRVLAVLLVVAVLCFGGVVSQSEAAFPEQPITIICPFAAGGGTDAVARIIATLMQNDLGKPVNVVNRTGGGGVTGHQAILQAKPDGYTIGLGTAELAMFHWVGLSDIKASDFEPIGGVNLDSAAITVKAGTWKDYASLLADVKANKGKYTASGTVIRGIWHLAMAAWLVGAGLEPDQVRWIPLEGAAPAQQELLAGGIDMVTCSLPEVSALVNEGKLTMLAYMNDSRSPRFPDVPTLKELGVPVSIGTWRGICGPRGIPADVLSVLEASVKKAVDSDEFKQFMDGRGLGVRYLSAKDWGAFMVEADNQFGDVIKAAGLSQ
ncbi:MAG: tripartite tricarboxylate transporter substrate binding protein [Synergistaceae bacterium]|jgi:tripartite-type tricarboxylate transporter receptor subunit TctC|nr:tripartite tricarboxylate transporter substrate binding protein [Synergistaceae bacterium]